MARFDTSELDALVLDMEEISRIDGETMSEMLEAGAEVLRKAHEESIKSHFTSRSGTLGSSPGVVKRVSGKQKYALIYPQGTHHTYRAVTGDGVARNAEVGFVLEFGGHGNYPSQWMREANEKKADDAVDEMAKVYDRFLSKHRL